MRLLNIPVIIVLGILCSAVLPVSARAQTVCDTTLVSENVKLCVKVISESEFLGLSAKYSVKTDPLKKLGFDEMVNALTPEYEFSVGDKSETEPQFVIKRNGVKIYSGWAEFEAYYPESGVVLFSSPGGDSSDEPVLLENGEVTYNPEYTVVSKDGRYRITSIYNGYEANNYRIWMKDKKSGEFVEYVYLGWMLGRLPQDKFGYGNFLSDIFFHGDTMYYRSCTLYDTPAVYVSLTFI